MLGSLIKTASDVSRFPEVESSRESMELAEIGRHRGEGFTSQRVGIVHVGSRNASCEAQSGSAECVVVMGGRDCETAQPVDIDASPSMEHQELASRKLRPSWIHAGLY